MVKSAFFVAIAAMLAIAATLQFVLVYEFKAKCAGHDISTAPTVAGICLLGSFVLNGGWLMARKRQAKTAIRAALFLWTATVTVGVAAAGGALGQSFMYDTVCVDDQGASTLETDINIELLQYASIALLVLTVAAPHALKKKGTTVGGSDASKPLTGGELTEQKPLVFL